MDPCNQFLGQHDIWSFSTLTHSMSAPGCIQLALRSGLDLYLCYGMSDQQGGVSGTGLGATAGAPTGVRTVCSGSACTTTTWGSWTPAAGLPPLWRSRWSPPPLSTAPCKPGGPSLWTPQWMRAPTTATTMGACSVLKACYKHLLCLPMHSCSGTACKGSWRPCAATAVQIKPLMHQKPVGTDKVAACKAFVAHAVYAV